MMLNQSCVALTDADAQKVSSRCMLVRGETHLAAITRCRWHCSIMQEAKASAHCLCRSFCFFTLAATESLCLMKLTCHA